MSEKLILNLSEASELLGIRPAALYELTRSRARARQRHPIPVLRLGARRLAFRKSSLEAWVAELETENGGRLNAERSEGSGQ